MRQLAPLLYFAFAYVALQLLMAAVVLVQVLRMTFSILRPRALDAVPPLADDQAAAVKDLEALGFVPIRAGIVESDLPPYVMVLFRHATSPAFAHLRLQPGGNIGYPVSFFSRRADGTWLHTSNRMAWVQFAEPVHTLTEDPYADSLQAHWAAHVARIQRVELAPVSGDEFCDALERMIADFVPRLLEQRAIAADRGTLHPTLRRAFGAALGWLRHRRKLARAYASAATSGEHRASYFTRNYLALEAQQAQRPPRHNVKAAVLVASGAATLLLFGLAINWTTAVMLVVVIFVHEMGHALMMRRYGYRDMSMFFIPFVGALVTGQPREISAAKQALILFAGPFPGLLAGFAILVAQAHRALPGWGFDWDQLGVIAVMVNGFNLLPITPLDGGQLVEIALFARWPRSRLVFAGASAVAIAAFAWWQGAPAAIALSVVLVLGMRPQYRAMVLQRQWQPGLERGEQVRHLFDVACRTFPVQTFTTLAAAVKAVMTRRSVMKAAPLQSILILGTLLAFWSTVAWLAWPPAGAAAASVAVRQASRPPRTAAQVAFDAAYARAEDEDDDGAAAVARLAGLAKDLDAADARRVDLAYFIAENAEGAEHDRRLEQLVADGRNGVAHSIASIEQAWLGGIFWRSLRAPPAARAAVLEAGVARAMAIRPDGFAATIDVRLRLAEAHDLAGESDRAAAELADLRMRAESADDCRCALEKVLGATARFEVSHGRAANAVALIESSSFGPQISRFGLDLPTDYAWALLQSGRVAEGAEQMRVASTYMPRPPGVMQRLFNRRRVPGPVNYAPLSVAYAWHRNGRDGDVALLDRRSLDHHCRRVLAQSEAGTSQRPWEQSRQDVLRDFAQATCPHASGGAAAM